MIVDRREERSASFEALLINIAGKVEIPYPEIASGRLGSNCKGTIGRRKVSGVGALVRDVGNANVWAQVKGGNP